MTKRQPINSTAGQVAAMANSRAPLDPPSHVPLEPEAAGFWTEIVAARSREEWTPHDLAFAADQFAALCKVTLHEQTIFGVAACCPPQEADKVVSGAVEMFLARYGVR